MLTVVAVLVGALATQDSAGAALQAAREAQAVFERARRGLLPLSPGGPSQRCDERIGAFCYWYDAREAAPPPEGAAIERGREALLIDLGAAALRLPRDPWLIGQRVRYLHEAGRPDEAQELAARCAPESAWCAMLHGWALHAAGAIPRADSAFSRALAAMSAEERCQWLDLRLVLPTDQVSGWRRLPCAERARQAERWLELGRGLMALPGNSTRTEMLSRQVVVRIVEGTVTPYGMRFDADHREMVLRYGWPVGWSRVPGRWASEEASIIGHDPSPAWGLLPLGLDPPRWAIHADRPRARFQPPGVAALFDFDEAQVARFPRGGRLRLVAAWRLPANHPLNTPGATGVLAVSAVDGTTAVVARMEEGQGGVVEADTPTGIELAGIDLLHPGGAIWARHRTWWAAPLATTGPVLSDLLFFEPGSTEAETLAEVLPAVLPGTSVRRGARIGVYWEWSGLGAPATASVTRLQVTRERGGAPVLAWSWPAGAPGGATGAGSMVLDLARLDAGRYHLDVVLSAGGREIRSRRPFMVR